MKLKCIINSIVLAMFLPIYVSAQIVADNSFRAANTTTAMQRSNNTMSFEAGNHSVPIPLKQKISGLSVSGNITFIGSEGFVRIVLTDDKGNEYLVLETNSVFENKTSISFDEFCEETALLNNIVPKQITIECTDAQVTISDIQYANENQYQTNRGNQIKEEQLNSKLQHINTVLAQKEITWGAGKTSLSEMSYMEKKRFFGGELPNLGGFEYYVGGIFVMPGYNPNENVLQENGTRSQCVPAFDWRNRHGRNWLTSAKHQSLPQSCGSCWAFTAVGTTEAYVNLYYNRLLNLDLSEQDVLSCTPKVVYNNIVYNTCNGGYISDALNYIKNTGVVNEACFKYSASDLPCGNKCPSPSNPSNPSEKIKIGNYTSFYPTGKTPDDLKKLIIKSPLAFAMAWRPSVSHAVVLVGYKAIQVDDEILIANSTEHRWVTISAGNPLIGENAWLIKGSGGTSWGDNGFGYVVTDWSKIEAHSILGAVTSLQYNNANIICEDKDGDGYYYWGIGPKPATCPPCARDEPDGDDSNPNLGTIDAYGNFLPITDPTNTNPTTTASTGTWSTSPIYNNISISSGVTVTITATITAANCNIITIQNGGKLVLNGGTIDGATIIAKNGSTFTIQNNGKVVLGAANQLDVQLGATFNLDEGEVLLK